MAKGFSYTSSGDGEISLNNFVEISIDPVLLNNFSTEEGIGAFFNSCSTSEEFQQLKTELIKEVMYIIENCLTDKQREIMKMTYLEGKTQNEISIELGRHQTAIHKALKGNIDYGNSGKRYGGALKKIRKLCQKNEKVQSILVKMREKHQKNIEL
jgi:predicted DNA-binding protein YlxM (UPF0122 family)